MKFKAYRYTIMYHVWVMSAHNYSIAYSIIFFGVSELGRRGAYGVYCKSSAHSLQGSVGKIWSTPE